MTIYSWRGADPNLFTRLAKLNNAQLYELPINYRSTGAIVKAAAAVDRGPLAKKVKAVRPEGPRPAILRPKNEVEEAQALARILQDLDDPANSAVLVRCRFQAPPILQALQHAGVPYKAQDELQLENQPEVKQLIKFAEALAPESSATSEILRVWLRDASYAERKDILARAKTNPAGIYGVAREDRKSVV